MRFMNQDQGGGGALKATPGNSAPGEEYSTGYRCYVMAILFLVAVCNMMDRMILGILQPSIQKEFNLQDAEFSSLLQCFSLAFLLFGLPLGRIGDRYSRRNIVMICLALWSVMTACCGLAQNFWQLGLARAGVGAAEAGAFTIIHSIIADYFGPRRRATAMAFYSTGIPIGIMSAFALGGHITQVYGWREAFMLVGLPGLGLALVIWLTVKEPPRGHSESLVDSGQAPTILEMGRHLWSVRSYRNLVFAIALQSVTWYGIYHWSPTFFIRSHGMQEKAAGPQVGILIGACGLAGMIASGFLIDFVSRKDRRWSLWLCALAALIQVPLFAAALLASSKNASLAFLVAPMIIMAIFTVVPVTLVQGLAPLRMRATADAVRVFVAMNLFGNFVGSKLIGLLSDALKPRLTLEQDNLRYALLIIVSVANIAASVYCFRAARTLPQDLDAAIELRSNESQA
jgi:predicted MFS family arabinose efflux permease